MVTHGFRIQKLVHLYPSCSPSKFLFLGYAIRRISFRSSFALGAVKLPTKPFDINEMAAITDPASQSQATMKLENVSFSSLKEILLMSKKDRKEGYPQGN